MDRTIQKAADDTPSLPRFVRVPPVRGAIAETAMPQEGAQPPGSSPST
jgi:hypothetical protein